MGGAIYYYIRKGCIVHHINYIKSDNRIENLWLFTSNQEHGLVIGELQQCFMVLIKLGQVVLNVDSSSYFMRKDYDCRDLPPAEIKKILSFQFKPFHPYKRYLGSKGRWLAVLPPSYTNPFISTHQGKNTYIEEHLYIVAEYLSSLLTKTTLSHKEDIDLYQKALSAREQGKKNQVHHINFDPLDNRLENLHICFDQSEHRNIHSSIYSLVKELLEEKFISFNQGTYELHKNLLQNLIYD